MTWLLFFLTVFCGIFGAYIFIGILYKAVISIIGRGRTKNARNTDRGIHNHNRNG
ncbi:MAG: hypothetical protein IJ784_04815 [Ruminiclostridium sp.]|nr:hypothetical protein [Ruminiclostridium sp.]